MNLDRHLQAAVRHDRARVYLAGGLFDDAGQELTESLRLNSQRGESYLTQARIYLAQGEPGYALAALDAYDLNGDASKKNPSSTMLRARGLIGIGELELAAKLLESFVEEFADDVRPVRMLAAIFLKQGKSEQAIKHLRRLVELTPSDKAAQCLLAELLEDSDSRAAVELLEQVDAMEQDRVVALRLARVHRRRGELREAMERYRVLIAGDCDDAGLLAEAAEVAAETGELELAIDRLKQVIKMGRNSDELNVYRRQLGKVLMRAGRTSAAGYQWWLISRRTHDHPQALAGLLVCGLIEGRKKIVEYATGLLNIHTSKHERRIQLAKMWQYAAVSDVVAKVRYSVKEQKAGETSPLTMLLEKSTVILGQAAEQTSDRADVHYHLSRVADALGDRDVADEALHHALSINPRYLRAVRFSSHRDQRIAA